MKFKILIITAPKIGGCQYFRQIHAHEKLAEFEFDIKYRHVLDIISNRELSGYQMVQLHKNYVTADFLRRLKGLDIISMVDFDDYWELPTGHPSKAYYQQNCKPKEHVEIIKLADYISVTTDRLAIEVRKHNKNVFVFPNAISIQNPYAQKIELPRWEQLQVGYLAGSSHINDVEILQGLNNRLYNSGAKYDFNLCGYRHDTVYQKYAEIITSKGAYSENLHLHAPQPVPDYLALYNMFDVSLAPLRENKFNSLKSELKLVEAGNFSIPVIVSDVHPYKGIIKHNRNGLIATSKKDWYKHILFLSRNPKAARDLGKQLNLDINEKFNYARITREREEVYKSIIEQRNK